MRIQKFISSLWILAFFALCPSIKGGGLLNQVLPFSPCTAENCKTDRGILECLRTGSFGSYLFSERFFYKNENNQPVYRTISVVVEAKDTPTNGGTNKSDSYLKPVKVQKVIALMHPMAYKAFLKTMRKNPHCLRTFCHANCLRVTAIPSKAIKAQAALFSNAIVPLTIDGKTYSVDELKELDADQGKSLAMVYLLEARRSILSASCLGEDMNSVILRMICSQCPQVLPKSNSDLNVTCASFDPSQNVASAQQPQDSNPVIQIQLAASIITQSALTKRALGNTNNPAAMADLNQLTAQLNALYGNPTSTFEELVDTYNHAKDAADPSRSTVQRASDVYNTGRGFIAAY